MSRQMLGTGGFRDDESSDDSDDDDNNVFGATAGGGGGGGDGPTVGKSVAAIVRKDATVVTTVGGAEPAPSDKSAKKKKRKKKKKPQVGKQGTKGGPPPRTDDKMAAVASLKAVMFSDPHHVASVARPPSLSSSSRVASLRRAVPPPPKHVVEAAESMASPVAPSQAPSSGSVGARPSGEDHATAEVGSATISSCSASSAPPGSVVVASSSSSFSSSFPFSSSSLASQRSARHEARVRLSPRRFPAVAVATSEQKCGGDGDGAAGDGADGDGRRVAATEAASTAVLPPSSADKQDKSGTVADDDDATTDYTENESYVEDPRRARWKTMRAGVEGGYAYRGGTNVFAFVGCFRSERPVWRRWVRAMRYLCTSYLLCDTAHATDVGEELGAARRGITRAMKRYGVPGEVYCRPWVNFGVSKSHVWQMAREHPATRTAKYFVTCDADEVLLMQNRPDLHRPGHALFDAAREKRMYATVEFARELEAHLDALHRQQGATVFHFTTYLNGTVYPRPHIVHRSAPVRWRMPVQEHLDRMRGDPALQIRHVDLMLLWARKEGHSSRNARSPIDIRDLSKYVAKKPRSTRGHYYLGQAHGDSGDVPNAIRCYWRRYELSRLKNARGYDEEAYQSLVYLGSARVDDRKAREVALRIAVDQFPARLEAFQMLMQLLRLAEKHREAYELGRRAVALWRAGPPVSGLFVNSHVYTHAFALEYSLAANKSGAALAEAIYVAEEVLRAPERIDSAVRADIVRTFRRNLAAFRADLAAERARVAANLKAARLLAELGDGGFAAVAERQRQRMLADGDDGGGSGGVAKRHQSAIADIKRKLAEQAALRAAIRPAPPPSVSYPSQSSAAAASPTSSSRSFSSAPTRLAPPTATAASGERGNGSSSESECDTDEDEKDDDDNRSAATAAAADGKIEIGSDGSSKLRTTTVVATAVVAAATATESGGKSRLATASGGAVVAAVAPALVELRGNGSSSSSSGGGDDDDDDEDEDDAASDGNGDDDAADGASGDREPRLASECTSPLPSSSSLAPRDHGQQHTEDSATRPA